MAAKDIDQAIPNLSKELCNRLLLDLEKAKRPVLYATKCSLDNAIYKPQRGFFTPRRCPSTSPTSCNESPSMLAASECCSSPG